MSLWEELESCFLSRKKSDITPLAALYRLVVECIGADNVTACVNGAGVKEISLNDYSLKEEYWPLKKFKSSDIFIKHTNAKPRQESGFPIVVFLSKNICYVIDGNNRINKWLNETGLQNKSVRTFVIESKI
jgi:hypothetical protein